MIRVGLAGWSYEDWEGIVYPPKKGSKFDPLPYLAEFFDCVRTRKECSENALVGHHAAAAGHMVNLSYRAGKRMLWDAGSGTLKS